MTCIGRTLPAGVILAFCVATQCAAGPFEDGDAAYGRGDYATARDLWLPLAEGGDAKAQIMIGGMYADGAGVTQSYPNGAGLVSACRRTR